MRLRISRSRVAPSSAIVACQCPLSVKSDSRRLSTSLQAAAAQACHSAGARSLRRLSIDEAVKLALEQNLGIQIQRFDPQIQDTGLRRRGRSGRRSSARPSQKNSQTQPVVNQLLAGSASQAFTNSNSSSARVGARPRRCRGAARLLRHWNNSRFTTTNQFQQLQPAARLEPDAEVHAAAAPQLRDRSDPAAGRQQQEIRATSPTSSCESVIVADDCATCGTRTGISPTPSTT